MHLVLAAGERNPMPPSATAVPAATYPASSSLCADRAAPGARTGIRPVRSPAQAPGAYGPDQGSKSCCHSTDSIDRASSARAFAESVSAPRGWFRSSSG